MFWKAAGVYAFYSPWLRFPCVAANSLRIVGTGLLSSTGSDKAEGFFHTFSGWIIFVVSILLLFAVRRVLHWALDRTLYRPGAQVDPNSPDSHEKPAPETPS